MLFIIWYASYYSICYLLYYMLFIILYAKYYIILYDIINETKKRENS